MLVSQLILGGYPVSAAPPSWRGPCRPDACLRPCCRAIIGARRAGAVWLIRSCPARYSSSFRRAALVWTRARRRPTPRLTPRSRGFPSLALSFALAHWNLARFRLARSRLRSSGCAAELRSALICWRCLPFVQSCASQCSHCALCLLSQPHPFLSTPIPTT